MGPILELEADECIEDVDIMITITVRTNRDDYDEVFYTLEEAEAYLDQVEALK